jgi:hypothetical protein
MTMARSMLGRTDFAAGMETKQTFNAWLAAN